MATIVDDDALPLREMLMLMMMRMMMVMMMMMMLTVRAM